MSELDKILEIDIIGLSLVTLYGIFLFILFFTLLQREKLNSLRVSLLTLLSFIWPMFFFVIDRVIGLKSTPPDTLVYASLIQDFRENFNMYSFGVQGYSILNFIQYKLCFKRPFVFIIFNIFYYHIAVLFLYKGFKAFLVYQERVVNWRKLYMILVVLAAFYPITIIINTSILRESMAIMLLAFFSYFLIKYVTTKRKVLPLTLFILALIFITRPLIGVCSIIALLLGYCYKKKLYTVKNAIKLVLALVVVGFGIKSVISNIYQIEFDLDWLIAYRDASNTKFGNEGYSTMQWFGPTSYLVNICLLIAQYLLSPLPILVSSDVTMNKLIPLIDSFFIIFVLIIPILLFYKKHMRAWFFLFIIFLVVPALFETNISGAYRHRISAVFFLLPATSYVLSMLNLKRKIDGH